MTHIALNTPWGQPSSPITVLEHKAKDSSSSGGGKPLYAAFLSRHGQHHEIAPHELNSRANIAALRKLGVRCVVAFSAVGSLREAFKPRDFLVPDQVIDRTKGVRPFTYFEGGMVGHVAFAEPFDEPLRQVVIDAVKDTGVLGGNETRLHSDGVLVCMEGPQFSTRAESNLYRSWGATVINMSCLPEAKLAREAELAYAMICMSTDYDSWHETNEHVTVEMVMGHMKANAHNAKNVIAAVLDKLADPKHADVVAAKSWAGQSKFAASMTKELGRNPATLAKLEWLLPGYFQ